MSYIPKSTSFPAAGAAAWPPASPPPWRGFATETFSPIVDEAPAIWAADFAGGSYARIGVPASLSEMIETVRSSPALGLRADGFYSSFGVNEPVILPGAGLDIWGQYTNLYVNSSAISNWQKFECSVQADAALAPDGTMTADKLIESASAGFHFIKFSAPPLTEGTSYIIQAVFSAAEHSKPGLYLAPGRFPNDQRFAWFDLEAGVVGGAQTGVDAGIEEIGGGNFLCWASGVATSTGIGQSGVWMTKGELPPHPDSEYLGDGSSGFHVWGVLFTEGRIPVPPIITAGSLMTRLASDHRISDFAELYEAGDFGNGFRIAATVVLPSLSRGASATVIALGEDEGNCVKLEIGDDDRVRLVIRHGGADALELATGTAFATTGDKEIAALVRPGQFSLTATGLASAESTASVALPDIAATGPSVGSLWNTRHLQGVLKQMTLERIAP